MRASQFPGIVGERDIRKEFLSEVTISVDVRVPTYLPILCIYPSLVGGLDALSTIGVPICPHPDGLS